MERYRTQAPELLVAVEQGQDAPWIMRKSAVTGMCVKLEDGICGIHKQYGDKFLGDACHFYPRVTRALGEHTLMTATLSCPEIVRRVMAEETPYVFEAAEVERLPHTIKDYLPEGLTADEALGVHQAFLAAVEDRSASVEHVFARIASVSRSIELIDRKNWPQAVPMYIRLADGRLPAPDIHIADPFNLLHALSGLIVASKKPMSDRLRQTIADMEKALHATLDWQQILIHTQEDSLNAYQTLLASWQTQSAAYDIWLRRYLEMQLSLALYPFAGLGNNLIERITLIGVRLATIRLAFICNCGISDGMLSQDIAVRMVQSLSRFLDHLGDPAFSLQIYAETGWLKEARMRGLLST